MHKLIAHWIPKSLSNEEMATSVSKQLRMKGDNFLLCLVRTDKTLVHHYKQKKKKKKKDTQKLSVGRTYPVVPPRPKKFKMQSSAGKVMATAF